MVKGDCLYEENMADHVKLSQMEGAYRNGSNARPSYDGIPF